MGHARNGGQRCVPHAHVIIPSIANEDNEGVALRVERRAAAARQRARRSSRCVTASIAQRPLVTGYTIDVGAAGRRQAPARILVALLPSQARGDLSLVCDPPALMRPGVAPRQLWPWDGLAQIGCTREHVGRHRGRGGLALGIAADPRAYACRVGCRLVMRLARSASVPRQRWEGEVSREESFQHVAGTAGEGNVRARPRRLQHHFVKLRVGLKKQEAVVDAVVRSSRHPSGEVVGGIGGTDQVGIGMAAHPWQRVLFQTDVVDGDAQQAIVLVTQGPGEQRQRAASVRCRSHRMRARTHTSTDSIRAVWRAW